MEMDNIESSAVNRCRPTDYLMRENESISE